MLADDDDDVAQGEEEEHKSLSIQTAEAIFKKTKRVKKPEPRIVALL